MSIKKTAIYIRVSSDKQAQDGATVNYFTNLSKKVVSEEFLDLD